MFKPVFEHNRMEFERFERHKRWSLAGGLLGALIIAVLVLTMGPGNWLGWALALLFVVVFAAFGLCEIRKTIVFRRDLREQRDGQQRL